ncbi:MAG: hypothetical protein JWO11_2070 [Nocardioides sp.]|nr:hypothetical protein [Nocardioides sp.]
METGIVTLGDSIIAADDSWARWLSLATGQPLRRLAVGGAQSPDVLEQLPGLNGHRYDIACLTVGTNDVLFAWDPERFAADLAVIVGTAHERAGRVVTQSIPLGLHHFPGDGNAIRRRVEQANAILGASGDLVVVGEDLRAPLTLKSDRIHPTTRGQLLLADRAADLLAVEPRPSSFHDGTSDFSRGAYLRDTWELTAKGIARRALRHRSPTR